MANIPIDTKGATTYFQGNTWPPRDPAEEFLEKFSWKSDLFMENKCDMVSKFSCILSMVSY